MRKGYHVEHAQHLRTACDSSRQENRNNTENPIIANSWFDSLVTNNIFGLVVAKYDNVVVDWIMNWSCVGSGDGVLLNADWLFEQAEMRRTWCPAQARPRWKSELHYTMVLDKPHVKLMYLMQIA